MVTGHVDGVGRLLLRHPAGNSTIYQFQVPPSLMEYVVPKGSIAVDGISLTVAQIRGESFAAAVVPHTEAGHHAQGQADRRGGQHRGRRHGQVRQALRRPVRRHGRGGPDGASRRGLGDMLRDFAEGR